MAEVIPIRKLSSDQIEALLNEAASRVRAAQGFDERDDNLDPASLVAWYDRVVPNITDIKQIMGALEVEFLKRRGQAVIAQGEQRGGDQSKLSESESLLHAEHIKRSRARVVAEEAEAVDEYVQDTLKSNRVPTREGAERAARSSRAKKRGPTPKAKAKSKSPNKTYTFDRPAVVAPIYARIDTVRDQSLTLPKMAAKLGFEYPPPSTSGGRGERGLLRFLNDLALIPWASVTQEDDRYTVVVDEELRAICEGRVARPAAIAALEGKSVWGWIRSLDVEITRRRNANNDKFAGRWAPAEIRTAEQTEQLNWLQRQFKKVADLQ